MAKKKQKTSQPKSSNVISMDEFFHKQRYTKHSSCRQLIQLLEEFRTVAEKPTRKVIDEFIEWLESEIKKEGMDRSSADRYRLWHERLNHAMNHGQIKLLLSVFYYSLKGTLRPRRYIRVNQAVIGFMQRAAPDTNKEAKDKILINVNKSIQRVKTHLSGLRDTLNELIVLSEGNILVYIHEYEQWLQKQLEKPIADQAPNREFKQKTMKLIQTIGRSLDRGYFTWRERIRYRVF